MKKLVCLILTLLLAAGTLAGCHGTLVPDTTAVQTEAPGETQESGETGETQESQEAQETPGKDSTFVVPETFDTTKEIKLTFWLKNDNNKTQVGIYEKAMNDFMALYPNVTITAKKYTDYGEIYNDVITNIATKTTPNVCITYPDHIATYLTGKDTMVGLDELMADEKFGLGGSELKFDSPKTDEIVPKFLADNSNAIIVNAGDGAHEHPTQALLDMLTIEEKLGTLEGKNVTIIGDIRHSRVARSNLWGMSTMGAHVTLCGPSTLVPRNTDLMNHVTWEPDVKKAVANADAIIALRLQKERMDDALLPSMREYRNTFGITEELLECAKDKVIIMHPGPINRGVELDSDIADGEHSVILDQVTNGVAVRMAVLFLLAGGRNNENA